MKCLRYIQVISALLIVQSSVGQEAWTQRADFPGSARRNANVMVIGDSAYITCGYDGARYKDMYAYHAQSNSWSQKTDFPGSARDDGASFVIGAIGYCGAGTGGGGIFYDDIWKYEPGTGQWSAVANYSGGPKAGDRGFVINGKAYIGTGKTGPSTFYKEFWEYDSTSNAWSQKADFAGTARKSSESFVLNGIGYIGCGSNGSTRYNDFWAYDPVGNAWTQVADFAGTPRNSAFSFVLDGLAYVGLGGNGSTDFSDLWCYDPLADSWTQKLSFPGSARWGGNSFVLNGKAYITLGLITSSGNHIDDLWEYTPGEVVSITSETTASLSCNGDSSGSISVTAMGPDTIYYSIDGGLTFANTSGIFNNLTAGSYQVAAMSTSGDTVLGSVLTVSEPDLLMSLESGLSHVTCEGGLDGSTGVDVSGGTLPYTYSWDNGATTSSISSVGSGAYSVTVTDANTCVTTFSSSVNDGVALPLIGTIIGDTLVNENDVEVYSVSGVVGYTYQWVISGGNQISGMSTNSIEVQWGVEGTGVITVSAIDSLGCLGTGESIFITIDGLVNTIAQDPFETGLGIYPNPASRIAHIDLTSISGEGSVQIFDVRGANVLSQSINGGSHADLDLKGLDRGLYLCILSFSEKRYTVRLSLK